MRKLKHHEKKLLKKVDFFWQREGNIREIQVMRRYHITIVRNTLSTIEFAV